MIMVMMYGIMNNKRIQTERIPIFKTNEELYNGMKNEISTIQNIRENRNMSFTFPIEIIKKDEVRARLFASIPSMIEDYRIRDDFLKHANEFQIKTYLVLPYGECMLIKDFNKIYENLDKIEELGVNKIKENDNSKKETLEQFRDRMISLRNNATTVGEIIKATTGLAYVYDLIDNFIEEHRTSLQRDMIQSIKEIREEQEEINNLDNELDLLSKQAQVVLKEDTEDEFEQCIYNGLEITQDEMIKRLVSHKLYKEDLKEDEVYIEDTESDEYRIETKKLIIVREYGGKIKISKK